MIDKYDVFYGLSGGTKDKLIYWIYSFIFSSVLLFWFKDKNKMIYHLQMPTNSNEISPFLLSVFSMGLIIYILFLIAAVMIDIKQFKKVKNRYFIRTRTLNNFQKERLLKKIYIRKELFSIVVKPLSQSQVKLTEKQWKFYVRKIGTRNEILSRMKFLYYIENKIREDIPLKNKEMDYLNDLMFSKDDLDLFQKLKKDLSK